MQSKQLPKIQISYDLFMDLCRYHLSGLCDPDIERHIKSGLQDKLDRSAAREQYSKQLQQERSHHGQDK